MLFVLLINNRFLEKKKYKKNGIRLKNILHIDLERIIIKNKKMTQKQ